MRVQGKYYLLPCTAIVLFFFLILGLGMNQTVTVWTKNQPIQHSHTYIIDAGHGGVDGGATSCSGILESQYNLDIALRLNDLMHLLGQRTLMIRTDDRSVHTKGDSIAQKKISDLKHRVDIINNTSSAVLISIHQNHFADSRYSGAQVFYAQNEESRQLAEHLQSDMRSILNPDSKRLAKKADNIYLLKHIQCPGVLIECGFISNVNEDAKLRSPEYQKLLCCVVATNITRYFSSRQSLS